MSEMPIRWKAGVTTMLWHLRLHKDIVESVLPAEQLSLPSLRQGCIICTHLRDTAQFIMDRLTGKDGDSGWFIGCRDLTHDHNTLENLEHMSLYETIVCYAPQALPFIGLPAGVTVDVSAEAASV